MATYSEKLKDPRWQRKRLEILERDRWECCYCHDNDVTLHVHHYWYETGKDPWDYPDDCYVVLCDDCHKEWHINKLRLDKAVAGFGDFEAMIGLIEGLRSTAESGDLSFEPDCDPWRVAASVRGAWMPGEFQNDIAHKIIKRCNEEHLKTWLSDAVAEVIPMTEKYDYIWAWVKSCLRDSTGNQNYAKN